MNRERAKELLPIIQAFAEGKVIQGKHKDGHWVTMGEEQYWDWDKDLEYRIKPEPREFWIKVPDKSGITYALTDKECESGQWKEADIILVREVLDD